MGRTWRGLSNCPRRPVVRASASARPRCPWFESGSRHLGNRAYYEAGADAVETNTFGCNLSNLGDYDIADRIRDLSHKGTAVRGGSPTR